MGKQKPPDPKLNPAYSTIKKADTAYESTTKPSPLEGELGGVSGTMMGNYNQGAEQNVKDYGGIMGQYQQFGQNLAKPTKFSADQVSANRPAELGESYGYLREAMPGYRDFAQTGGYSDKDQQELRARGISPIRAAYGNSMRELDRARSIGGNGGAPNYIAALSRAQRELPEQMANATTNVNAGLAEQIREGKKFGLGGITGTGTAMGQLSSAEAGRQLQAAMANQQANLQASGMTEDALQNFYGNQLKGIGGQANLYGTTPGMASTFGNQALQAYNTRAGAETNRNQLGQSYLQSMMQGQISGQPPPKKPWWETALQIGGAVAGPVASALFPPAAPFLAGPQSHADF